MVICILWVDPCYGSIPDFCGISASLCFSIPHEVPPIGENDSEKADDKVHKSNQNVEKHRHAEIPQKSGIVIGAFGKKGKKLKDHFSSTDQAAPAPAEAVKERSRKKRIKTKVSFSDIPHEVPPIGEDDSEKADDKVYKSNQNVEKQRDVEIPQKSGIDPYQFSISFKDHNTNLMQTVYNCLYVRDF